MPPPPGSEKVYLGSASTVVTVSANATSGQVAGNNSVWTNTDYSPTALAVLTVSGHAVAPTAGRGYELYVVRQNLAGGTADATAGSTITSTPVTPSAGLTNYVGAEFVGYFPLQDLTGQQIVPIDIPIRSIYEATFFVRNDSGQTMSGASLTVAIQPYTSGPS